MKMDSLFAYQENEPKRTQTQQIANPARPGMGKQAAYFTTKTMIKGPRLSTSL
jgi:hypothetical protein